MDILARTILMSYLSCCEDTEGDAVSAALGKIDVGGGRCEGVG